MKNKKNRVLIIKGVKYQLKVSKTVLDEDGRDCHGLHDHVTKEILVADDEVYNITLMHEIFHAYLYECHLREGITQQLEEAVVECLAQGINKHFIVEWRIK